MKQHFEQFAAYNRWANARLYEAAFALPDDDYRRNVGAFFGSMHGTLNHLLATDLIWMKRLTGEGDSPERLDAILFEDRYKLAMVRADEDDRIMRYIASLNDDTIAATFKYTNISGKQFEQSLASVLAHLFNHQTHHRGQAHAILSICTKSEPPSLDLLAMQRGSPAPDLRGLVAR